MDVTSVLERPDIRPVAAVANETEAVFLLLTRMEDATILWASPALPLFFGYAVDEVVGRNALDFVHPDDLDDARVDRRSAAGGHTVSRGYRVRHRDGHYVTVRRVMWVSRGDVVVDVMVEPRD